MTWSRHFVMVDMILFNLHQYNLHLHGVFDSIDSLMDLANPLCLVPKSLQETQSSLNCWHNAWVYPKSLFAFSCPHCCQHKPPYFTFPHPDSVLTPYHCSTTLGLPTSLPPCVLMMKPVLFHDCNDPTFSVTPGQPTITPMTVWWISAQC